MRFIHMADVHLGAEPESGTPLGPIRKQEIWDAFRDVLALCEREQIELLLIPGDLFHGQPLLRDVKEVDYLFRKLTNTQVVMIAGNHDCLLPTSHYYDVTFPEHVTFLMDTRADSVYLPALNTEVFGLSYETKQIPEARYDSIRIRDKRRINILIAHGNIHGNDKSIPIHKEAIQAAGFDYAALGHIHTRIDTGEKIAYSGGFEPFERKETGPKGYICGEIIKTGEAPAMLRWEFVPHANREYVVLEHRVTVEDTGLSVCESLREKMQAKGMQHMYLVTLTGTRSRERIWDLDGIREGIRLQGGWLVELTDKTVADFNLEELKREQQGTLVGRFIEAMEQEEEQQGSLALQYGLQALLAMDTGK